MTATLTTPAFPFTSADGPPRPRPLTVEQRLEGAWKDLRFRGSAECPLCRAPMQRAPDGSGECTGCGTKLT